jgi:hypothetical protein
MVRLRAHQMSPAECCARTATSANRQIAPARDGLFDPDAARRYGPGPSFR